MRSTMMSKTVVLGLVSTVSGTNIFPSISEMLNDWDARVAAKAAGLDLPSTTLHKMDESAPGLVPTANQRSRRQTRIGQLEGNYVADCTVNSSWFGGGSLNMVAQATTTQYNVSSNPRSVDNTNGTFEVDYTEYVGGDCNPGSERFDAKAFAKYNVRGQIAYHGTGSPPYQDCYKAEWVIGESDWVFPDDDTSDPDVTRLLAILNAQCPCGGDWKKGQAGARTINPSHCSKDNVTSHSFSLCAIVAGLPTYALYKYTGNTQKIQYQSSPLAFTPQDGWYTRPNSNPRSRLPQSDAHSPEDCSWTLPTLCGIKDGVLQDVANSCDGCTRLECTGCAFRLMENSKDVSNPEGFWSGCCPCAWYMGQERGQSWMNFNC